MKIGAFQFAVTGNPTENLQAMESAAAQASLQQVELLVFPECALTGYPPYDLENSAAVDFQALEACFRHLQTLSETYRIHLLVGTITKNADSYFNSVILFSPGSQAPVYHKRALWGWDRDNFTAGDRPGIFELSGFKLGVRICFEVRFPEYFRELYREGTDLNIILFYDVSDSDDAQRYDLIKAHIRTRAVENVCHILTVDAIHPYQTAPTALFDRSGAVVQELTKNEPGLLVFDLEHSPLSFGEAGRKTVSDILVKDTHSSLS